MMKLGEILHGFKLNNKRYIEEQKAELLEFVHPTGAKLIYLATKDVNKLFSVAFKTLPSNDTGVFHILEHSVLCGSEAFPVKEPFVELLKSSMNTFLNAMTFPDKTMYPVSSKNEQDFMNLTKVYLDAVFKPAIYTNKNIFLQEGWHYEMRNIKDEAVYKGVVLNEMKGATSSVNTRIDNEMMRQLYPDNCYQYVSGGAPEHITDLTYEEFIANHKKYYHPSNAYFYLEGDMNLERVFNEISTYLEGYEDNHEDYDLPMQSPVEKKEMVMYYPLAQGEDASERTQISFGKVIASYEEKKKLSAINILSDYLTGSNEAPLKKAIISKHLAQDFYTVLTDGIEQAFFQIQVVNTEASRLEEIKATIKDTIREILEKGLNRKQLEASLNHMEFNARDVGEPKALMHNIQVLNAWLYGGDPLTYLTYNEMFTSLRHDLDTHYYEDLLKELFDDQFVVITAVPSETLDVEEKQLEKERLLDHINTMSEEEKEAVIKENKALDDWQKMKDSDEALATIPRLSLKDMNPLPEKIPTDVHEVEGVKVLVHPFGNEGIVYLNVYFELDVKDKDTLSAISFFPNLLGSLPTKRELTDLLIDMKGHTGRLSFDLGSTSQPGDTDDLRIFLIAKCNVLSSKVKDAIRLIKEILCETDFTRKDFIKPLLLQVQEGFRNDIINSGHQYAMRRALSSYSKEAFFNEVMDGLDAYFYLKDLSSSFDEKADAFIEKLRDVQLHQLTRNRMIIGLTSSTSYDELETSLVDPLIHAFDQATGMEGTHLSVEQSENIGIEIPNGVSYASLAYNLYALHGVYSGIWRVASTVLSFDYLWNEVRVKGGAYGTGFASGSLGTLAYYSYRDPDVARSLEIYRHAGDYLRTFAKEGDVEQFIISSIAKCEPLRSARSQGELADGNYLRGIDYERECLYRNEMLEMKPESLLDIADTLDEMGKMASVCVIGHKGALEKCQDVLGQIKTLG